ncbi:anaerobic sulfatase maturase [Vibrio sp. FNV 38]|nr:anaerobic sulfatase maturase [Vibrio sp. FNV 38]
MPQVSSCHVMAKPSGSVCNIDCKYCFYLEKEQLYPERKKNWKMSEQTLEVYIRQHIEAQKTNEVQFAWQGGEPTMLGIDFYKKVVELCEIYKGDKLIHHAFQTNGLVLDDEWCQFFKENNFLVGISIDGPEHLHDYYRKTRSNKGTYRKVIVAIELLKKYQIEFNTLTVVSAENAKHPLDVYNSLKEIGSSYIQFIPLVERESGIKSDDKQVLAAPGEYQVSMTPWSVGSEQFGDFLSTIFDHWVRNDVGKIFVQMFDSTLASWLGEQAGMCFFAERCGHAFALEANGDLYQCDHYVYPEYKLGNIHERTIDEMNQSSAAIKFGEEKQTLLNEQCKSCTYKFACHGGCPKHRFEAGNSGKIGHNYLCQGYYKFFSHSENKMKIMGSLIQSRQSPAHIMHYLAAQEFRNLSKNRFNKAIGRNDPCTCGSGKKYKHCCC